METFVTKEINLLYTHWNTSFTDKNVKKEIPNGSEMGFAKGIFTDFSNFISSYIIGDRCDIDNRDIKVNKVDLNKYNSSDKYFYAISHPGKSLNEILTETDGVLINDSILELSNKNDNIYFIFSYEHEVDHEDVWTRLSKYIEGNKLNKNKFIIINNDYNIYRANSYYNIGINVHKLGFIKHSSYRTLRELTPIFQEEKNGKFFMCRNRSAKPHRISLISTLIENGIMEDVNYSFIPHAHRMDCFIALEPYLDKSFIEKNGDMIKYVMNHSKICDYESKKNWINQKNNEFQSDQPPIFRVPELQESFENSYVNIITESIFSSNCNSIHHSEKSFRPFFYYQFPIFLATPNHVAYLRNNYNFDMFDDIINHSYDTVSDDFTRFKMVCDEISRISENKDNFKRFYSDNKHRFIKNKQILDTISTQSQLQDLNFLWNFL